MVRQGTGFSGHETHRMYLNVSGGVIGEGARFADISAVTGYDLPDDGRGLVLSDWDGDGDLDIWTSNRSAPRLRLLENRLSGGKHWLRLGLQGTSCNRDAIGARVEIRLPGVKGDPPRVQTLRAGHGYLSQSSKWLHFGLGGDRPGKVVAVVRWPGGASEEFSFGEGVDRSYRLVQGSGTARPVAAAKRVDLTGGGALGSGGPGQPGADDVRSLRLASRFPVVAISYNGNDGKAARFRPSGMPVLVHLWSSQGESETGTLAALVACHEQLKEIGVQVLALSTDAPEGDPKQMKEGLELVKGLAPPFQTGFATSETLAMVFVLRDTVYESRLALPIPMSLLLNGRSEAVAIHYARVDAPVIVADLLAGAETAPDLRFKNALPFPGRWFAMPVSFRLTDYLGKLLELGHAIEVAQWVKRNPGLFKGYEGRATFFAGLGAALERGGQAGEALEWFEAAVAARPDDPNGLVSLAGKYVAARNGRRAEATVRKALEIDPDHVNARFTLATVLMNTGRGIEAEDGFRRVLEKQPDHPGARTNLAIGAARKGEFDKAIAELRKVLVTHPEYADASFNLGQCLEASGQPEDALPEYVRTVESAPGHARALQRLSWLAATLPPEHRKPQEAKEAAGKFAAIVGQSHPNALECFAAASAASGEVVEAREWLRLAVESARKQNQPRLAEGIRARSRIYLKD